MGVLLCTDVGLFFCWQMKNLWLRHMTLTSLQLCWKSGAMKWSEICCVSVCQHHSPPHSLPHPQAHFQHNVEWLHTNTLKCHFSTAMLAAILSLIPRLISCQKSCNVGLGMRLSIPSIIGLVPDLYSGKAWEWGYLDYTLCLFVMCRRCSLSRSAWLVYGSAPLWLAVLFRVLCLGFSFVSGCTLPLLTVCSAVMMDTRQTMLKPSMQPSWAP